MKICVLLKQVPEKDVDIKIKDDGKLVDLDNVNMVINECDNYALEEALLIKETLGCEVIVCSFGIESTNQVIKDALSKGADRGILINNDTDYAPDILSISKFLKTILEKEKFDLILSGLQSDDIGNGQLGILMAELLDMSHASLVMETKIESEKSIEVKRELENGWFQWTTLNLPASISIQSGINKPRYASLRGIMMMKKKTIDILPLSELIENKENKSTIETIYIPKKSTDTVIIEGEADDIANKIIHILKEEIRII